MAEEEQQIEQEKPDSEGIVPNSEEIPQWTDQITVRGLIVSLILGIIFCVITHKLNLTVGVIPSLNVAAGLLGFFFVKTWTSSLVRLGFFTKPFTRQENTVIQTCVVACYGIAFSGGFGSYMLAMNRKTYNLIGPEYPGNNPSDIKDPALGWMTAFVFTCSFVGLLALVPLRKVMVIDYKLTYPSGTATAVLINSFHTISGAKTARCARVCVCVCREREILFITLRGIHVQYEKYKLPVTESDVSEPLLETNNTERKLNEMFMKEGVPFWLAAVGYLILSLISMFVIPVLFPALKWYHVLVCYIFCPAIGFCNAYGTGLTDFGFAATYGKLALFIFAAWAGENGGVIAGLAACGIMMSTVATTCYLMQDFKTAYLTLTSPRSMFISQLVGDNRVN